LVCLITFALALALTARVAEGLTFWTREESWLDIML
jgi:hypothetical protein